MQLKKRKDTFYEQLETALDASPSLEAKSTGNGNSLSIW